MKIALQADVELEEETRIASADRSHHSELEVPAPAIVMNMSRCATVPNFPSNVDIFPIPEMDICD